MIASYKKIHVKGVHYTVRIDEESEGEISKCRCLRSGTSGDDSASGWSENGNGVDGETLLSEEHEVDDDGDDEDAGRRLLEVLNSVTKGSGDGYDSHGQVNASRGDSNRPILDGVIMSAEINVSPINDKDSNSNHVQFDGVVGTGALGIVQRNDSAENLGENALTCQETSGRLNEDIALVGSGIQAQIVRNNGLANVNSPSRELVEDLISTGDNTGHGGNKTKLRSV